MHWNETSTSRHCPQTCGYNLKKDVVFLPISALTAANIVKPYEVCPFALGIAGLCSFQLSDLTHLELYVSSAVVLSVTYPCSHDISRLPR